MYRTETSNVLVVGTGAAGHRAAIAATQAGVQVLMLGKRAPLDAHTVLASGGINAALGTRDPKDSWEQHFADTLSEGYFLGDPRMIEIMARDSPDTVLELTAWGCEFARTESGDLDQRFFGAHRWRRTCFAGDFTGREIMRTVAAKAAELRIRVEEDQYVSRLLVADGRCFGAVAFDLHTGERTVHLADAVILATGGHTRIWRRSSSRRDENYGDGMSMALDAGFRLMDMELVQFHPTGMVFPEEAAGTLVTEAVRGEGGRLYNALGERYMERYDPVRLELSSRDRVALANYTEIIEGRGGPHGGVFLDVTHRGKDVIVERLPRMYRQFVEWQCSTSHASPWKLRQPPITRWVESSSTPTRMRPTCRVCMPPGNASADSMAPTDLAETRSARRSSPDGAPARRPRPTDSEARVLFGRGARSTKDSTTWTH